MKNTRGVVIGGSAIVLTAVFFIVPFLFILVIASKTLTESALLEFSWPTEFVLFDNISQAFAARDYLMVIAFINSVILTVVSVAALVLLSAMVAYVWQRRPGKLTGLVGALVLAGLILIEIAYGLPFCILLFRAFIAGVPKELDEAATVDGAGPVQIFFRVIFP